MGCYGIGLGRLMGTIAEISHDEKGIVWPASVAPFMAQLLVLGKASDAVTKEADALYAVLEKAGIPTLYDDRSSATAGEKLADADLLGMPWRIVVSEKTIEKNGVELKKRNEKESRILSLKEAITEVRSL